MRLLTYLLSLILFYSCTTIEVTREVVKVGSVVKEKVEEKFEKEETEIVDEKTILQEQKIITEEKEQEKSIIKSQQELTQINPRIRRIQRVKRSMMK